MKLSDIQVGIPEQVYKDTQTNIEGLSSPNTGMVAYATDTDVYLYYNGASWSEVGGGGIGSWIEPVAGSSGTYSGTAYAWKGLAMYIADTCQVAAVGANGNFNTGHSLKFGIFRMSGNTIAEVVYKSSATITPWYPGWCIEYFLDTPVTLTVGNTYWIACGHVAGTATYVLPISMPAGEITTNSRHMYQNTAYSTWRLASLDPVVSDVCDAVTGYKCGTYVGLLRNGSD